MYKTNARNEISRQSRILMRDMPHEYEEMTKDQQIEWLRDTIKRIEAKLVASPRKSKERKELARQKVPIQAELARLNGADGKRRNIASCFLDAAHTELDRETYNMIMEKAKHIHDVRYKAEMEANEAQRQSDMKRCMDKL